MKAELARAASVLTETHAEERLKSRRGFLGVRLSQTDLRVISVAATAELPHSSES